jgi:formylglycine-generating enzyme required for sulfatase activity
MALAGPRHYSSNIKGDVNADGEVNIADVNVLISTILGGENNPKCDLNEDGEINIADINVLIDLILNGPELITVDTGMYMGIIGYNQTLTTKEISVLDTTTVCDFTDFVASLTTQPGRLMYYSVDKAIDALNAAPYPKNLQNVAVVTFTEGLDQGSLMMTDKYDTEAEYAQALKARITDERIYGRSIKAYSVGLINDNVRDANQFRSNLYALASDSTKAIEVTGMDEVTDCFRNIAADVVGRSMSETLTLIFPGVGTGTRIRFTLDDVNAETVNDSQVYIEGTFSLKSRSLTDIVYKGMKCTAGDSVVASSIDGMFVNMVFEGIQLDSEECINKDNIQEWYLIEGQNEWEPSTEFSASRLPDVESVYYSTIVMLLLDCSSVMDENFAELQQSVNEFMESLQKINSGTPEPDPGIFTVNGVTFQMATVDGGTFSMGIDSTLVAQGYANLDEMPVHEVTLSPYRIGLTEVTQELWQAVMGDNPSSFTGDLQRPVEQVSWEDCQEFIARLNELTGENFRLPTEAEWEYAARGAVYGNGTMYAGSNNIADVAWYFDNSYAMGVDSEDYGTHVVGSKLANELGLFDMSGNVAEWCADWYGAYTEDAQTDPVGPETGMRRVTRGGGWFSFDGDNRVTARNYELANRRSASLGFRLAL